MASVPLSLLAAGLGLVIQGPSTCPTTGEVAAALKPLLREEISGTDDRLVLALVAQGLRVSLLDSHGAQLAQQVLPGIASCEAQAHRVAVIAAAWQAELSEEPLPPMPEAAPEAPADAAKSPAPPSAPVQPTIKELEDEVDRGSRLWPAPATQAALHPNPAFLGLDYRLSYTPVGGVVSVLALEGGAIWGRWGLQGGGWFELPRDATTGQAGFKFERIAGELGPVWVAFSGDPQIQVRAQVVGAALFAESTSFDPGVELAGRLVAGHPPARVFIDVAATLWPRFVGNVPGIPLSPFELFLSVGLFLGGS